MKKGLIPVTLGVAVTTAGLAIDSNQSKARRFKSRDYANMTGALLVGVGVAHIALGAIDMLKE
ncbi:asparagine synthase [Romboutsia sp. 13368]|uniref:asparagine synthase n=1 Tax=Romboutsia sp. 13368 TaxID=2708053 RepID=UPI0025D12D39|nr:asparagine synthase [Romboutsia sp. 13368]